MQLNSVQPVMSLHITPSFQGNMRKITSKDGKDLYWTTTYFFRSGFEWNHFTDYICSKYKDVPKVNIINHACSCGAEAVSVVISLLEKLQDKSKKFFPIIAKDIERSNIVMAKFNYPIDLTESELDRVEYYTNNKLSKYFSYVVPSDGKYKIALKPNKSVRSNIKFYQSDILNDAMYLPQNNTILLCRNMWMYLEDAEQELLAQRLGERLDKTSMVVIGECDIQYSKAVEYLKKNSFRQTKINGVFVPKSSSIFWCQSVNLFLHNLSNKIQKLILRQKQGNKNL